MRMMFVLLLFIASSSLFSQECRYFLKNEGAHPFVMRPFKAVQDEYKKFTIKPDQTVVIQLKSQGGICPSLVDFFHVGGAIDSWHKERYLEKREALSMKTLRLLWSDEYISIDAQGDLIHLSYWPTLPQAVLSASALALGGGVLLELYPNLPFYVYICFYALTHGIYIP